MSKGGQTAEEDVEVREEVEEVEEDRDCDGEEGKSLIVGGGNIVNVFTFGK
ncbi:hypothetical protein DFA_02556 [Cavenderia fasciculata]|uniref:Uncharacterized protein n=1 Tax=Cavenderia fasciculata TaxID=261658 RepID=F4PZQ3_CACFS|nr:uncharacterized protein DFA_02556 [Cavenderia fasciculata]EGG18817.1 hypothetical protein DFA_02556 [Cavenderia fasciculata]|eukprot:XP_004357279.1 hypothetical protein DFA_02556 [Cavenderia fasciculata]